MFTATARKIFRNRYYHSGALWFKLGRKTRSLHLPWDMHFVRLSKLLADGVTMDTEYAGKNRRFWDQSAWPVGHFWQATYPYAYTLKNGEVQERTATVTVEEREWRPRATRWLPVFRHIRRTINVAFSDEVGERAGSWKGGCVGCSYEMKRGETPLDTLRRMERERTF